VIAIIALLVTILMPSLSRAKDLARRAVCASNLRTIGLAGQQFAAEQDGYVPAAFHWDQWFSRVMPVVRLGASGLDGVAGGYPAEPSGYSPTPMGEFDDITDMYNHNTGPGWRRCGTSWDTYREYGLVRRALDCPSDDDVPEASPGYRGTWLTADYLLVGGVVAKGNTYFVGQGDGNDWDEKDLCPWTKDDRIPRPIVNLSDDRPSDLILGADVIRDDQWNHDGDDPDLPGYQNILWGDGHMGSRPDGYYQDPLDASNHSFAGYLGSRDLFYWHQ